MNIQGSCKLGYPASEVFTEGIKSNHWRQEYNGISIRPEDDLIEPGGVVDLRFTIPKLPLPVKIPVLECLAVVSEYRRDEQVTLAGEDSKIGAMSLAFILEEQTPGITTVSYDFEASFNRVRLFKSVTESLIRPPLSLAIGSYASHLTGEISNALQPEPMADAA